MHWSGKIGHPQRSRRTEYEEQDAYDRNNFKIRVWSQQGGWFHTSIQGITRQQECGEKRGPCLTKGMARVPAAWLPPLTVEAAMILGSQGTGHRVQSQQRLCHSANSRCLKIELDEWQAGNFRLFSVRVRISQKWSRQKFVGSHPQLLWNKTLEKPMRCGLKIWTQSSQKSTPVLVNLCNLTEHLD